MSKQDKLIALATLEDDEEDHEAPMEGEEEVIRGENGTIEFVSTSCLGLAFERNKRGVNINKIF